MRLMRIIAPRRNHNNKNDKDIIYLRTVCQAEFCLRTKRIQYGFQRRLIPGGRTGRNNPIQLGYHQNEWAGHNRWQFRGCSIYLPAAPQRINLPCYWHDHIQGCFDSGPFYKAAQSHTRCHPRWTSPSRLSTRPFWFGQTGRQGYPWNSRHACADSTFRNCRHHQPKKHSSGISLNCWTNSVIAGTTIAETWQQTLGNIRPHQKVPMGSWRSQIPQSQVPAWFYRRRGYCSGRIKMVRAQSRRVGSI